MKVLNGSLEERMTTKPELSKIAEDRKKHSQDDDLTKRNTFMYQIYEIQVLF